MDLEVGFIFIIGAAVGWLAHAVCQRLAKIRRDKIIRLQPVLGVVSPKGKYER